MNNTQVTLLPEVQKDLFDGLIASNRGFDLDEYLAHVLDSNPNVYAMLITIEKRLGRESMIGALLIYRMLETQAECNDLKDEPR